jgi:FKBP-type peptidyl-prolyl cis-trans isomerase FkpA
MRFFAKPSATLGELMRSTTRLLVGAMALVLLAACNRDKAPEVVTITNNSQPPGEAQPMNTPKIPAAAEVPPPADLTITELQPGKGATIASGSTAVVHYTGWLYDPKAPDHKGAKFDSSRDRNDPFPFPLGRGQVITGWDKGVEGMKVGEQRRLVIPPGMGYGEHGAGDVIPPNATLVFDVELLEIR